MAAVRAGKVGIVAADDYIHGKQYERLDAVRYEGGVYLAKKHNVSEYPTVGESNEYWMFMIQDGSITGVKGDKEKEYRPGPLVNLTPEDIGSLSTDGGSVNGSLIILDDLVIGDPANKHVEIGHDNVDAKEKLYLNKNGGDVELGTNSSGVVVPSVEELRVIFSGVDHKLSASNVTKEELEYLSGITSNVQRQLDSKASLDTVGSEWESIARVNRYSRVAKLNGYAAYLFTLFITQNSQVAIYTYLIGVSYNAVYIAQIASSGYTLNSNITLRIVQGATADEYYIEVLNTYLSSGSPDLPCKCRIIMLSNTPDAYVTMYNFYYQAVDSATVRASITSKPDGMIVSKIYGNLEGEVNGELSGTFNGDVNGNVTGNLKGNVEGNVKGDVTGDLTGNVEGNVKGNVTGNLTGSVNGNVTGDLTGNVEGNVKGNVTGNLTGSVNGDVTGNLTGSASEWCGYKLVYLSESDYQRLSPKDSKTIYMRPKA